MNPCNIKELYTTREFCELNKISMSTFNRLVKSGKGPKLIRLNARVLITEEAIIEWRKNMES